MKTSRMHKEERRRDTDFRESKCSGKDSAFKGSPLWTRNITFPLKEIRLIHGTWTINLPSHQVKRDTCKNAFRRIICQLAILCQISLVHREAQGYQSSNVLRQSSYLCVQ